MAQLTSVLFLLRLIRSTRALQSLPFRMKILAEAACPCAKVVTRESEISKREQQVRMVDSDAHPAGNGGKAIAAMGTAADLLMIELCGQFPLIVPGSQQHGKISCPASAGLGLLIVEDVGVVPQVAPYVAREWCPSLHLEVSGFGTVCH